MDLLALCQAVIILQAVKNWQPKRKTVTNGSGRSQIQFPHDLSFFDQGKNRWKISLWGIRLKMDLAVNKRRDRMERHGGIDRIIQNGMAYPFQQN